MSRVDFYVVENTEPNAHTIYVCRLITKVYQAKHKIYVHCNSLKEAQFYDELLWTFEDDSFIPHHLVGEGLIPPPPVQLGYDSSPTDSNDVLINLHQEIPGFFKQFRRIVEVVPNDPNQRQIARQHFRYYREAGCEVKSHDVAGRSGS